jgi:beta-galactosidase
MRRFVFRHMPGAIQWSLIAAALLTVLNAGMVMAAPGRWETDLTGPGWKLSLDRSAAWTDDDIFLPPVDLSKVPVNPPSGGWDTLAASGAREVDIPGTVEGYLWGWSGNPIGIAGDYRGVSWWTKTFSLDSSLKGKKIFIYIESVNLRAEVFVNRKLVGYDVVGNTPFELDVTDAANIGGENTLAIRVTDPVGNFDWNDNEMYRWGKHMIPGVHGFGGVTGRVRVRAVDPVRVDDIYVQNKPNPREAEVFVTLGSSAGAAVRGKLSLTISEWKNPASVVFRKTVSLSVPSAGMQVPVKVNVPKALLWGIRDPHLYVASVSFSGDGGKIADSAEKRFGFRFFTIGEKNGSPTPDPRFYLNGKRVVIFAAMTRGCWAKSGMCPSPEMARRDVESTLLLGFNMMLFHRAIGQNLVTELCDEAGILTYEEPGGYRCLPAPDDAAKVLRREKLRRMIVRDRTYPSLVIYNLKNEALELPDDDDIANMKMVFALDPSRILTYNSDRNRTISGTERLSKDPIKLHLRPFDPTFRYFGWWDQHHWNPQAGYMDYYYRNPEFYLRYTINDHDSLPAVPRDEIIFWGEEGAFGTQVRLQKIKEELDRTGVNGWRDAEIVDWFRNYDRFLDESGFRAAFPTVDALTLALGKNMHYFHGRILENVRMSNFADGYNLNGWASEATHCDIADLYRYPTADPAILQYYTQPLYVAVKLRTKVLPKGGTSIADFFLINEKDLKGPLTLETELADPAGKTVFSKSFTVTVLGGEEYGQPLAAGVALPALDSPGYYKVNARLRDASGVKASGSDDLFVADWRTGPGFKGRCAVIDTSGVINAFLKEARGITLPAFDPNGPDLDYIIVGPCDARTLQRVYRPIMERVSNGARLIVVSDPERWAQEMDSIYDFQSIQYLGSMHWGNRGRLFVGKSPFLAGLPTAQAMGWEYQDFYEGDISGLNMGELGVETIVAVSAEHRKEILNALVRIPFADGQIFLSTLDLVGELKSNRPESAVGKRLFMNLLETNPSSAK